VTLARGDGEARLDPADCGSEERRVLRRSARADHAGERVDPEGAFERALHGERAVYAVGDDAGLVGTGAEQVARGDERGEHGVAHFEARVARMRGRFT